MSEHMQLDLHCISYKSIASLGRILCDLPEVSIHTNFTMSCGRAGSVQLNKGALDVVFGGDVSRNEDGLAPCFLHYLLCLLLKPDILHHSDPV